MEFNLSKFILIAGPCSVENEKVPMDVAEGIVRVLEKYPNVKYIFKSSWKKANRTRSDSFTGIDFDAAMKILTKVRETFQVPILTDVHETHEVELLEPFIDYLQTPSFLCRQKDLIQAAAKSKPLNIKKGQFISPNNMQYVLRGAQEVSDKEIFLCERGSCFGYDNLVVDFTAIPIMKTFGVPVLLDTTHCLQKQSGVGVTGGQRQYVPHMARAAIAVGADGLFMEVHSDIENAQSDKESQLELKNFEEVIDSCMSLHDLVSK
jgi:2-dehydro-3-deoxyphosphooctonate aldolase (KDO 8-P synthase)